MFYLAQEQIQSLSLHNSQLLPSVSFLAWKEIQQKSIFLRLKEDQELNHLVHRLQTLKQLIHKLFFLLREIKLWVY